MTQHDMMNQIDAILTETKSAVLATVDAEGRPHARWMTPVVLREWPGILLAVTAPDFHKVIQLDSNNKVEWLIQTKALNKVINVRGGVNVIDNPSLKAQVMEAVGKQFGVFWRVNSDKTDFVILETVIEEAALYEPMKGKREIVRFGDGEA